MERHPHSFTGSIADFQLRQRAQETNICFRMFWKSFIAFDRYTTTTRRPPWSRLKPRTFCSTGGPDVRRGRDDIPHLLVSVPFVLCVRVPQQGHSDQTVRARLVPEFLLAGHVQLDGEPDHLLLDESQVGCSNAQGKRRVEKYNFKSIFFTRVRRQ